MPLRRGDESSSLMTTHSRQTAVATEGTKTDARFQLLRDLETTGNESAEPCHTSKATAVHCLQAAIESFLAARQLSREYLAENLCGMSLGNFSKISNGVQGDFMDLVFNKLPGDIKEDFVERLAEMQRVDPFVNACKHLVLAAFAVIEHTRGSRLPMRAKHMAQMDPAQDQRKRA